MAHRFDSGFVVRRPAWHGLATVLDEPPANWEEARKAAGLDWDPVEGALYVPAIHDMDDSPLVELDGWKAIRRNDNGTLLSVQRDSYTIFPNRELGPLVESLLDEPDVVYETAGSLKEGRKVWVLVRLADPVEIPGDSNGTTLNYLAVQNAHDGSSALRAQKLATRIVCDNTSMAADREASRHGYAYTFRHTKNMDVRIEQARAAINGLRQDRVDYLAWAEELIGIPVDEMQRRQFVNTFAPMPPAKETVSDRVVANIEQARRQIHEILDGPTCEGIADTAYGLVQASIEYAEHVRTAHTRETHFTRTYLRENKLARKAEKIAREVATT